MDGVLGIDGTVFTKQGIDVERAKFKGGRLKSRARV
jgi:hypothetical protein